MIMKSLNSDGQQFHQYQQSEQSPQIIEHKKKHIYLNIASVYIISKLSSYSIHFI